MPVLRHKRAVVAAAASFCLLAVPEAWAGSWAGTEADTEAGTGVAVVAHRGASAWAPENTLSAVAQAVASRADFIEVDIRLTKDGVPVLVHNRTLASTSDVESVFPERSPWRVQDFTLSEVQRLDAGSWQSASYAGERIPTLAAFLQQVSQSPSGAILEVKDPAVFGGLKGIGAKVYDTIRSQWPSALTGTGTRRLVVASADESFVRDFAARYPELQVSVIAKSAPPETVTAFADDVQLEQDAVTPDLVADLRAAGLTLGAWTVNDTATMTRLGAEVDSITTDEPARLRKTLAAEQRLYTPTTWPAREEERPSWSVTTSGNYLNTRVEVRARLTEADGTPARWQRAAVQRRVDGYWNTVLLRATDATGGFSTSVLGRSGLELRVVTVEDWQYPIAASSARKVSLRRVETSLRVGGPRSVRPQRPATLTIRWETTDGRAVSGRARLFRRPAGGGSWRYVRDLTVSNGLRRTRVHPRRATSYQVRGRADWWHTSATGGHRVRVVR